jgi:type I restriction enzyme S subunit
MGRPRLGLKIIRQIPVPLPVLDEQRRIVEILNDHISRLDAAANYAEASLTRIDSLHKAALDEVFGLHGSGIHLRDVITRVEAGKSLGGAAPPAATDEWGIVKVSAMTWGEFRPNENKAIPQSEANPRYEIHEGDLLVSRANTSEYVGASVLVGRVRPHLLLSDKSLRLIPAAGVTSEWLLRALQSPSARRQISALATGTKDSMRNISQQALLQVSIPDPRHVDQPSVIRRFDELAAGLSLLAKAAGISKRRGVSLRRSLLAAAFDGKLTGRGTDQEVIEEAMARV